MARIDTVATLDGRGPEDFAGFTMLGFASEPGQRLLAMLHGCEAVELAVHDGHVVGYGAVIGDGNTFAFLTSLEVLPDWRGQGIGSTLVRRLQDRFSGRYAFDLACDEGLVGFYEALGFTKATAMLSRNYGGLS